MKHPSVKVDIGKTIRDTTNKDVSNSLKWGDLLYREASRRLFLTRKPLAHNVRDPTHKVKSSKGRGRPSLGRSLP